MAGDLAFINYHHMLSSNCFLNRSLVLFKILQNTWGDGSSHILTWCGLLQLLTPFCSCIIATWEQDERKWSPEPISHLWCPSVNEDVKGKAVTHHAHQQKWMYREGEERPEEKALKRVRWTPTMERDEECREDGENVKDERELVIAQLPWREFGCEQVPKQFPCHKGGEQGRG